MPEKLKEFAADGFKIVIFTYVHINNVQLAVRYSNRYGMIQVYLHYQDYHDSLKPSMFLCKSKHGETELQE